MKIRNALGAWAPVIAWMIVIFAFSAQPASGEQSGWLAALLAGLVGANADPGALTAFEHLLRKGAHVSEYAVLAALLHRAQGPARAPWPRFGLAIAGAVLYAATDELHQHFVPNRGPSPLDVGIDASGALLGAGLAALWARRRRLSAGER